MANEFIVRKGYIALEDSQITGSLSVTNSVTASFFTGSYRGDGSQLTGIEGFPFTGSAGITGSLTVVGPVNATTFTGDGSQLTGIEGFPFTGSAKITGSLEVTGSVTATSFTGSLQGTATSASYIQLANIDGFTAYSASVNTAIDSVLDATTPLTATVNTTNSPFTITSQSIVIIDSTDGDVTVNLPDLNAINGTPDQKPILLYKNDYSQNVIYVQPSGSQLVNGTTQDIIVSIQIAIAYNPTSAGWVTEGTSYQSLAELELFFVPRTETGSLSVATASYVEYANVANRPTLVSGSSQITYSGLTGVPVGIVSGSEQVTYSGLTGIPSGIVSGSSQISFNGITDKPTLVSGSSQITYSGLTGIPSGILSGSAQIANFGIFATTGSNQFNGNQSITGSLTVSGQVVAQTLNVQQVTSSIVYSSGSNIFGNSLANTQQFTGSVGVTGSLTVAGAGTFSSTVTAGGNFLIPAGSGLAWSGDSSRIMTPEDNVSGALIQTPGIIRFNAGGTTPRVIISALGALLVGTTNTYSNLATQGDIVLQDKLIFGADQTGSANNRNWSIETNSSQNGSFDLVNSSANNNWPNAAYRLSLTRDGNLGLGVTPSTWTLGKALEVGNLGNGIWNYGVSNTNIVTNAIWNNGHKYASNGAATQYAQNNGNHEWLIAPSGTAGNAISFTQAMTLDASGRLGIGTTSPSQRLHVANSAGGVVAFLQSTATNGEPTLSLEGRNSSGTVRSATFKYDNADLLRIGTASPIDFRFETNDVERMRITSGGNVGIGLVPTERLEVNGSLRLNDGNADGPQLKLASSGYSDWNIDNFSGNLRAYYGSSEYLRVTSGGNVLIGTTTDNGRKLNVNGAGLFSGTLSTAKVEVGAVNSVNITTNSTFTLIPSGNFNIRTNILVSVTIRWDSNANAQRQYLLFIGATDTGWGTPNSAISVIASNDWSSGYVGAATFSIGGSGQSRTLNISVSNAATYNVTAFASIVDM